MTLAVCMDRRSLQPLRRKRAIAIFEALPLQRRWRSTVERRIRVPALHPDLVIPAEPSETVTQLSISGRIQNAMPSCAVVQLVLLVQVLPMLFNIWRRGGAQEGGAEANSHLNSALAAENDGCNPNSKQGDNTMREPLISSPGNCLSALLRVEPARPYVAKFSMPSHVERVPNDPSINLSPPKKYRAEARPRHPSPPQRKLN